jgi:hypothetical protein
METTIAAFEMGPFKRYVPQQTSGSPLAATLDNSVKSLVSRFASTRQGAVAVIDQIEKALQ